MAKEIIPSNTPKEPSSLQVMAIPMILFLIFIGGMGYVFFHQVTEHTPINKYANTSTTRTPITSLSEETMKSGRFALGSAMSGGDLQFIYFEGNESIRLKKLESKYVTIKMDENEHPYLETLEYTNCYEFKDSSNNYCERSWFFLTEYTFHVPNGTFVIANYIDKGGK